jgi:hypothetical protein
VRVLLSCLSSFQVVAENAEPTADDVSKTIKGSAKDAGTIVQTYAAAASASLETVAHDVAENAEPAAEKVRSFFRRHSM